MENDTRSLTTDELLELAADRTRRVVLRYLLEESDGQVRVEELVSIVCATTGPTVGTQPASHDTIRTRLHHRHLPKLAESGVIEYEEGDSSVRYRSDERLEALLAFLDEQE